VSSHLFLYGRRAIVRVQLTGLAAVQIILPVAVAILPPKCPLGLHLSRREEWQKQEARLRPLSNRRAEAVAESE